MRDDICLGIFIVGILLILGAAGASDCGSNADTSGIILTGMALMGTSTLGAKL